MGDWLQASFVLVESEDQETARRLAIGYGGASGEAERL